MFFICLCHVLASWAQEAYMTSPDGGMYKFNRKKKIEYCPSKLNVLYTVEFLRDSTKTDNYTKGQTVLMISDKYLLFKDYYQIKEDSINDYLATDKKTARDERANDEFDIAAKKCTFDIATLTDLSERHTTVQMGNIFKFQYDMTTPEMDWKIENKDSVINGIKCKKASCHYAGRTYTAWYAEEYPMPYGPYLFGGLPGLIIQLYDSKRHWIFTNNGISKAVPTDILYLYKDKKYKKMPREKALAAYRNVSEDLANMMVEAGIIGGEIGTDGVLRKVTYPRTPCNMIELQW